MNMTEHHVGDEVRAVSFTEFTQDASQRWRWRTFTENGSDILADSGQGYQAPAPALNGFFAAQGFPDWDAMRNRRGTQAGDRHWSQTLVTPDGYSDVRYISEGQKYRVTKFETVTKTNENVLKIPKK